MTSKENCCNYAFLPLIGRILLGIIFFLSGISKIFNFNQSVEFLRAAGANTGPEILIAIALLFEIIGGALVILGWFTKIGSLMLMIFLIPVTFTMHAFWNFEGMEQMEQMANFMRNFAIFGGLLLLFTYGPGRLSFDDRCKKC